MLPLSEEHTRLLGSLNAWAENRDSGEAAAVRLLIGHERWVRDETVVGLCMTREPGGRVSVNWAALRQRLAAGEFASASSSERAVLDFAVALAEDRYFTSRMGGRAGGLMCEALMQALGIVRAPAR